MGHIAHLRKISMNKHLRIKKMIFKLTPSMYYLPLEKRKTLHLNKLIFTMYFRSLFVIIAPWKRAWPII